MLAGPRGLRLRREPCWVTWLLVPFPARDTLHQPGDSGEGLFTKACLRSLPCSFSAHIAHHPLVALDVDGVCVGNIVLFILFFHLYFKSAL